MQTNSRRTGLLYLLGAIAVASAGVFVASALRNWRGGSAAGAASDATWAVWGMGAALVTLIYLVTERAGAWEVGTREVVYMAIGAALYGVLSWLTNAFPVSFGSLVSLRPAVAIPLVFGWIFGPVVGFFAGAMGNILGDFLTGWGVFPTWDLGNGLMGMIVGLFRRRGGLGHAEADGAPASQATGPLHKRRSRYPVAALIASCVAITVGMGFAAASSIYVNGYTPAQAFTVEFIPAVGTNIVMALIFVPMLLRAWEGVRERSGR